MKQIVMKLFLFLSLLVSSPTAIANTPQPAHGPSGQTLNDKLSLELVYLDQETCRSIVELKYLLPDHA